MNTENDNEITNGSVNEPIINENSVNQENQVSTESSEISEDQQLEILKNEATNYGLKFHPNIGLETLRERINLFLLELDKETDKPDVEIEHNEKRLKDIVQSKDANTKAREEALSLVRLRVTAMDPSKKEYTGEIFCAGNSIVGTVKKFVPFATDWHVPKIIFNMIEQRKFQTFSEVAMPGGGKVKRGRLVPAYAIDVLDPLTEDEIKELKQRQLMASGKVT